MAQAEARERVILQAVTAKDIVLVLTPDEAQIVRDAMEYVGGDPRNSPRRHIKGIQDALDSVGVVSEFIERRKRTLGTSGLFYLDYDEVK